MVAWLMVLPVVAAETPFSREVLPILSDLCFACHGPDEAARKGGLRLDTQAGALGTGRSGKVAVVPGHSTGSEVIRRILTSDPDDRMPPSGSNRAITEDQVAVLQRWIDQGATWGRHWSYEPLDRPAVPATARPEHRGWIRNPIDAFVVRRLEQEGMEPSEEAGRSTLLRRVTLDLTGLPPSPEEQERFEQDAGPGAYERWVDRLLSSPQWGERMAWEWLEASRYADSNGYQGDNDRTMWPWRDWVVEALNRNLAFDAFTTWQIAGDLIPGATVEQRLATGFLRNHMINGEGGRIPEENRIDYLFDQTETVGTVWLGATFNCTRCHDHKFDPYSQRDYFSFLAFFNRTAVDGSGGDPQSRPNLEMPSPEQVAERTAFQAQWLAAAKATSEYEARWRPDAEDRNSGSAGVSTGTTSRADEGAGSGSTSAEAAGGVGETPPKEIRELLQVPAERRDAGRLEKLASYWKEREPDYARTLEAQRQVRSQWDALNRRVPRVMVMEDLAEARPTHVLNRGLYHQPGERVEAAVPASLNSFPQGAPTNRLGLAQWLLAPDQPLTARVLVNRQWQSLFGVGLVKTSEDFGVQGERPVHPELLDWLASEWVASGWDLRHLIRLMVTSATYRQSSVVSAEGRERDPENRLLARGARFRLPSWMIRDQALAVSGLLERQVGGPPVKPYQPGGIWEEATFGAKSYPQDHGAALYRRSLYVFWRRIVGPPFFFDVASRQVCTVKTPRTNVPLHALLTLNDEAQVEAARVLAGRLLRGEAEREVARLDQLFRRVLARPAEAEELERLTEALTRFREAYGRDRASAAALLAVGEAPRDPALDPVEHAAWTLVCQTVLNLDETLTKE